MPQDSSGGNLLGEKREVFGSWEAEQPLGHFGMLVIWEDIFWYLESSEIGNQSMKVYS